MAKKSARGVKAEAVKKVKDGKIAKPESTPSVKSASQISSMIKTADVGNHKDADGVITSGVSEKLQKAGYPVIAVGGGLIGDVKVHYFKISLKEAKELKDKTTGKPLLNENDLSLIEETETITPSKVNETGLKEKLSSSLPEENTDAD